MGIILDFYPNIILRKLTFMSIKIKLPEIFICGRQKNQSDHFFCCRECNFSYAPHSVGDAYRVLIDWMGMNDSDT